MATSEHARFRVQEYNEKDDSEMRQFSKLYANPFQSLEFYEVLLRVKSVRPELLIARDRNDDIAGSVISMTAPRFSLLSRTVVQFGPVIRSGDEGICLKILRDLLIGICQHNRRSIDIYVRAPFTDLSEAFDELSFSRADPVLDGMVFINLEEEVEQLWQGLNKRCRNSVRKASAQGVQIEEVTSVEQLAEYYSLYASVARDWYVTYPFSLFEGIFRYLVPRGMAMIYLAKHDSEVIAGVTNLTYRSRVYQWNNVTSKHGRNLDANNLLNWHSMTRSKDRGALFYVHYGLSTAGDPQSRSSFKRSFGGIVLDSSRGYYKVNSVTRRTAINRMLRLENTHTSNVLVGTLKRLLLG